MFVGTPRFRILETLGKGGVGVVYRVRDEEMQRDVALKTLRRLTVDDLYQLKAEFRALTGIVHPNLVELHELFVDEEGAYFTMEVVDGLSLLDHLWSDEGDGPGISAGGIARLEAALPQLIEAIAALHDAGRLHRDVKPSNLMVAWEGRVVLLDFGLAIGWRRGRGQDTAPQPTDTPRATPGTGPYMSPEQAEGLPLTPASDWYSLGVVLYEALTGQLPFPVSRAEALPLQRSDSFARPSTLHPALPERLDKLVVDLLQGDAARRPDAAALLQWVRAGERISAPPSYPPRGSVLEAHPFVGRTSELGALASADRRAGEGHNVVVRVEGRSGMGKSELIRHFLHGFEEDRGRAILRGRCRPQESLPFKAFDGLIDALSRHLVRAPALLGLLPDESRRALLRLFPVLGRGQEGGAEVPSAETEVDPRTVRDRGFEGLRALLTAFAKQQRLVLSIDDIQWADQDSVALARSLFAGPEAPPLLLLLSVQSEHLHDPVVLSFWEALGPGAHPDDRQTLVVGPLPPDEAEHLASQLVGASRPSLVARSRTLVAESAGSPFDLLALARWSVERPNEEPQLNEVLRRQLTAIDPIERELLTLVAVSGRPIERSLLLRASGVGESGRRELSRLVGLSFLRLARVDGQPAVETRHDRVRAAVLDATFDSTKRECHRRLATALTATEAPDAATLAQHWQLAGDTRQAAHWARLGAERAVQTMAFDQAADLYGLALEAEHVEHPRWRLLQSRAEALVGAGRGGQAAEAFAKAASMLEAEAPGVEEVLDLRREAAAQYVCSGRYAEGFRVMRGVLSAVKVSLPESPRLATASALAGRLRLLVRGTRIAATPRTLDRRALRRLDAMWSAVASLSMVQPAHADALGVQHLLESLDLGEPSRVVRAVGYEATCEASLGGRFFRARVKRLLDEVDGIARETRVPYDQAWARMARGTSAWFEGRWSASLDACDAALGIYRNHCRGVAWEVATSEIYALSSLSLLGRIGALGVRVPKVLREAEGHEDLFAAGGYVLGEQCLHWLAQDQVAEWRALAERARATWPEGVWHVQRYQHLVATLQVLLYEGKGRDAFAHCMTEWKGLEAAQLLRLECVRIEALQLRARAALGAALDGGIPGWDRARLHRLVLSDATDLARSDLGWTAPLAAMLRGAVYAQQGKHHEAITQWREAAVGFDAVEMSLFANVVRAARGRLLGGDEGATQRQQLSTWMRAEGVRTPDALARCLVPVSA